MTPVASYPRIGSKVKERYRCHTEIIYGDIDSQKLDELRDNGRGMK
jgi:hypothetical protein